MGQEAKSSAQVAYEAYGNYRHWYTYDNKAMPQWSELGEAIQEAWMAAANAVYMLYVNNSK